MDEQGVEQNLQVLNETIPIQNKDIHVKHVYLVPLIVVSSVHQLNLVY